MKESECLTFFEEALRILQQDIFDPKVADTMPFNAAFKAIDKSDNSSLKNLSLSQQSLEDLTRLQAQLKSSIPSEGESKESLLSLLRAFLLAAPRTDQQHYYGQRYAGKLEFSSMISAMFGELMNISLYTFEISNVYTLMETTFKDYLFSLLRWEHGDYIFTPGPVCANFYGISVASYSKNNAIRERGMRELDKAVIYCAVWHYSEVSRMAKFSGHGTNSVKIVASDDLGRLLPQALEQEIERDMEADAIPLMVYAALCPRELDVCDHIQALYEVCHPRGVWLHVDASAGGALMFLTAPGVTLPQQTEDETLLGDVRVVTKGLAFADSVTWAPHEGLNVPLNCALFAVREREDILKNVFATYAVYLFQEDKYYDRTFDTGDKSVQCSRKNDILKLWSSWLALGTNGLAERVWEKLRFANYLRKQMLNHSELFQVVPLQTFTVLLFTLQNDEVGGSQKEQNKMLRQLQRELLKRNNLILKVIVLPQAKYTCVRVNNAVHHVPLSFRLAVNQVPTAWDQEFHFILTELTEAMSNVKGMFATSTTQ